jgi:hypothetical protein
LGSINWDWQIQWQIGCNSNYHDNVKATIENYIVIPCEMDTKEKKSARKMFYLR